MELQNIQISERLIHTSNAPGFGNNFDGHSRIFFYLYIFLIPTIIFSENLIHISLKF